jgi:hypothetical protein
MNGLQHLIDTCEYNVHTMRNDEKEKYTIDLSIKYPNKFGRHVCVPRPQSTLLKNECGSGCQHLT